MAEIDSKLHSLLEEIAKEQDLQSYSTQVKPISSGGANYTSNLFVAIVTSKNKTDLHLFIKVAAMGDKIRNDTEFKIYDVEKYIYTELLKSFEQLELENGVGERDRLRVPKYYGASTVTMEEMLVLEDLTRRGFLSHDRLKSIDWEYAAAAITELAKFHALSMAYEHKYPDGYVKTRRFLNYGDATQSEGLKRFWEGSKKSAINVVRAENRDKLEKFLDALDLAAFWSLFDPSRKELLIHADFRTSNLMHKRRDDGSLEVVAVDYQTLRAGCPVTDLLYFIFTGTDAEFRANYYDKLVDHYHVELSAAMTRLGLRPDENYSREDYEFELKSKLPFGLAVAVFALPIVTVEAENAPKVDHSMDLSDFSIQKTGTLFPERLNGVVDDFVRWGVL